MPYEIHLGQVHLILFPSYCSVYQYRLKISVKYQTTLWEPELSQLIIHRILKVSCGKLTSCKWNYFKSMQLFLYKKQKVKF